MCWHKYKWSEIKNEQLTETCVGMMYPSEVRGKAINVTYWYQDTYCVKCNKYFYRKITK